METGAGTHALPEDVECHSEHAYAQRPTALCWQGLRLEIAEVLAQWRHPEGVCFKVRTCEHGIFELTYNESNDQWIIYQP